MIRVVLREPQKVMQVGRIWSQRDRVFQFVNRVIESTLRGQRDGVPLQQIRLFRRRPQTAFEIRTCLGGVAGLHFSHSGKEVSIRSRASVLIQLNFGQLHLIDAVSL